jgi:hypothetical protein
LLQDLEADLKLARAGKPSKDGKALKEESVESKLEKKRAQLRKTEIQAKVWGRC